VRDPVPTPIWYSLTNCGESTEEYELRRDTADRYNVGTRHGVPQVKLPSDAAT
jgi:hypothetical protein